MAFYYKSISSTSSDVLFLFGFVRRTQNREKTHTSKFVLAQTKVEIERKKTSTEQNGESLRHPESNHNLM